MNFHVPKEFEDFVTNTEDLLEQLKNQSKLKSNNDIVSYQIQWDNLFQYNSKLEQSIELLKSISNIINPLVKDYIWHNEAFGLSIKISKGTIILFGQTCVDDCIEDEWFIVYLLLIITKHINCVFINVVDSDGEFILIEVSDYLEDWIGPENTINRVWLYQGKLHIIPLDEPGKLKNNGIKLESAFKCLQTSSSSTKSNSSVCSNNIQQMLYNRTIDIYPAKALAYSHTFVCILPLWISKLFDIFPEFLAKSINSFHNTDKEQIREVSIKTKFHELNEHIHDEILIVRSIKLTRHLYAKLTFKNFHPPRKYHERMRRVSLSSSRKVIKAFEIGCRLTCGLEYLYQNNLHDRNNSKVHLSLTRLCDDTNYDWLELLKYMKTIKYTLDTINIEKLKYLYQHRLLNIEESNSHYTKDYRDEMICFLIEKEILAMKLNNNLNVIDNDQDIFEKILNNQILIDDDAWLYMTPDELDKELQDRIAHYKVIGVAAENPNATNANIDDNNNNNTSGSNINNNISSTNEVCTTTTTSNKASSLEMQNIIDGMKTFLSSESDYDGISSSSTSHRDISNTVYHHNTTIYKQVANNTSNEDRLPIDYDYLNKLLSQQCNVQTMNQDNSNTTNNTNTTDVNNPNKTNNDDSDLFKYFSQNDVEEFDNSDDSDDEEDEENNDNNNTLNHDYKKYGMKTNNNNNNNNNNASNTTSTFISHETYESQGLFTLPNNNNIEYKKNKMNAHANNTTTNTVYHIDSDDESNNDNNSDNDSDNDSDNSEMNEILIKEYQSMMDKELFQSSSILANTFEWTGSNSKDLEGNNNGIYNDLEGNDEIDIDMTLLKNITEAQSQAMGNPFTGPLGQLMSQIGINLPIPPPMKTKTTL